MQSFAKSHIGQRKINEDSFLIEEDLGLFIVADGVGGLDKGEIASNLACKIVKESIVSGFTLEESVNSAHKKILDEISNNQDKKGMATTIVALLFKENSYELAWVGDSRAYLWNEKDLTLITKDDSYVEMLLENGHINVDELETHPDRNVISQALGVTRKNIIVNHNSGTLSDNQTLLICSDGLYNIAKEFDIIQLLKHSSNLEDATNLLVDKAVEKDGKDNITLISIKNKSRVENLSGLIKPTVYREFNRQTGEIIGNDLFSQANKPQENYEELDPELVDQTQLRELTKEQMGLIDSAIHQSAPSSQQKKLTPYIIPALLVFIIVIVGFIVLV